MIECQQAHDWMFQAETPISAADAPPEVTDHLRDCAVCQETSRVLLGLEQEYRAAPPPLASELAKRAFLHQLPRVRLPQPPPVSQRPVR